MKTLGDLGEKEAVKRLIAGIRSSVSIGPGDDAAAIDMGDYLLVISTDLISARTHMPETMSEWQMGWTVAAVNYSDIAAMGAKPIGIVLSLGLPRSTEYRSLEDILNGAQDCSAEVDAEVLGGDTKESSEMTLVGTAIGVVGKGEILLRRGAKEGDLLAVTGSLGLAAAGFQAAKGKLRCPKCLKALLEPVPKVREGLTMSSSGFVTSCMDISDGLAISVHHLSEASGVAFDVEWEKIPIDPSVSRIAKESGTPLEDLALYYGGDYQLLFTVDPKGIERLKGRLGKEMSVIGVAKGGGENHLIKGGRRLRLENRGYEHFR